MAEKKIQENPLPEPAEPDKEPEMPKPKPAVPEAAPRLCMPSLTKTPPNELYRRLLPAVLFLLTFVTVMTMLLIYMDTVALGAQQFRLNMSRDYELARIPQESPSLVAYVRQLHLAPRPRPPAAPPALAAAAARRAALAALDRLLGPIENGTFVEFMARGPRDPTTLFLETARGWGGVVVRAAPRDFLALRGAARALHACLSPTAHPREVTYNESGEHDTLFRSRVLCLPLYTVLLAAEAAAADYVLLAGPAPLRHVPFHQTRLKVIEHRTSDAAARNETTQFLLTKNYTVAASFPDSVMYALRL